MESEQDNAEQTTQDQAATAEQQTPAETSVAETPAEQPVLEQTPTEPQVDTQVDDEPEMLPQPAGTDVADDSADSQADAPSQTETPQTETPDAETVAPETDQPADASENTSVESTDAQQALTDESAESQVESETIEESAADTSPSSETTGPENSKVETTESENSQAETTEADATDAIEAQTPGTQDAEVTEAAGQETSEQTNNHETETETSESEASETEPSFGLGAGLMFHAPDPDEIRAAAEAATARQREAAKERDNQRRQSRQQDDDDADEDDSSGNVTSRRRRRRRRGDVDMELVDEADGTVTRVRAPRVSESGAGEVTGLKGSTRLEAKKQRRRESRQSGRRRHVITEAEFLARRESVERKMLVRQKEDRIQIGVLEDGVLAEHFVSHTQQDSLIGNVYVGKVQNVLPSMEAAFVDIGRGRNAVLYAGEVDWDAAELGNKPRKIENALKSGDSVLVQVTKDPVGHKGARLTSQVSLPGRYLVYVPGGSMTGISRKLPDVERQRLKKILKDRLPEGAGVIVRTAAEGASEEELTNDINRLRSQWEQIQEKAGSTKTLAPEMLYAEPDLTIKTVRDVFNEDFTAMVVQGEQAWDNIEAYVTYVAPDLLDRLQQWTEDTDLFESFRVEEQIQKALDRKVYLPSGGSLVIDRTEAMTVVDVNTGKFTGSGGNLEETVTKNNLEAAEEIVRQLRLRDIGGIIVVDFIDMVLESNRELVLRRLVECLGRDRTKHQVAEVTSLGLVQMTRKRMGTGLLEVFSEPCEACAGRGAIVHDHPLKGRAGDSAPDHRNNRNERKRSKHKQQHQGGQQSNQQDKPKNSGNGGNNGSDNGNEGNDQESKARAEAARNALASIAAASQHDDDAASGHQGGDQSGERSGGKEQTPDQGKDQSGSQDHGDQDGDRRRKKRRGKRSRGRAQSGQDSQGNDSQSKDASDSDGQDRDRGSEDKGENQSSSLTIHGEVIELPHGGGSPEDQPESGQQSLTLDSLTAAFTEAPAQDSSQEQPTRGNRRSRSRRAQRGATHESRQGSEQSTAESAETADSSKQSGSEQKSGAPAQSSSGQSAGASAPKQAASRQGAAPAATTETKPATRRRSRRASAPTAAPGTASVQKHEPVSSTGTVKRFTADASKQDAPKSSSQPTVVGVGVKAANMKMTGGSKD
ncbi:Rne/Rng family ribonuclease [Kocuria sp. CPCC 205235]|uniref:Rne/Rng family ribonuclease n=1 Tax=Kocuria sp. CPCC 205235 TaxID=3073549 RepID=UPI0034D69D2E